MKKTLLNKRTFKQVVIITTFVLVNLLLISLLSKIYYEFNSGADRSKLLHIDLKNNTYYLPKIKVNYDNVEGRDPNEEIIKNIKKDYLKSWYVKKYALQNNDYNAIEDFYTDSAQVKIKKIIQFNSKNSINIRSTSVNHNVTIKFFSEDGQVVYLDDKNVEEQTFYYKKKKLIHQEKTLKNYKAILLLEDGFWRVRHIISDKILLKENETFKTTNKNFKIKGINYYPQKTSWFDFWKKYDSITVNKDFNIIKKLKLNTVRIFIPYKLFGKENVSEIYLNHLKNTLDLAKKNNLKVIVTFFDFYSNYQVLDYTLCDRHLETIINEIKKHPAILQYDIKNEPDLDFKNYGKEKVLNWLDFISSRIRIYDQKTPITIGWSTPEVGHLLKNKMDFISFHYYKKTIDFKNAYLNLKKKVNKPIVVQEFGRHSYNSIWNLYRYSEKKQAKYHKNMQQNFHDLNINHFVSWTLYDFPKIDVKIFGKMPHKIGPQKSFGFIDKKGNLKKAAKYIVTYK
ncbi:Glycosyl hydrolase catalytic core [Tenacibaculum sp. MAR_2010_89]|uniref:glycosyl hydrolase n=1 Tax=Tenacibaculum sp. MAR_2010_89 TaxID=1250198 RepID=UPI00089904B9|nr:glycosyl hydrolase [Tenacibaculum sp. MAR_2010_89]SEE45814.1 Glycosyl hydrolase catalytic core [Tenacibaculum sp. MAR_2010_89]